MQYVHRKLHRSVTEMRRSWIGRPSVSRGRVSLEVVLITRMVAAAGRDAVRLVSVTNAHRGRAGRPDRPPDVPYANDPALVVLTGSEYEVRRRLTLWACAVVMDCRGTGASYRHSAGPRRQRCHSGSAQPSLATPLR